MSEVAQNSLRGQVELTTQAEERAIAAENEVTDMHRRVESLKEENKEQLKELMAQREDRGADLANKTMEIERLQLHIRTMTDQVSCVFCKCFKRSRA